MIKNARSGRDSTLRGVQTDAKEASSHPVGASDEQVAELGSRAVTAAAICNGSGVNRSYEDEVEDPCEFDGWMLDEKWDDMIEWKKKVTTANEELGSELLEDLGEPMEYDATTIHQ